MKELKKHRCYHSQMSPQQTRVIIQVIVQKRYNRRQTSISSGYLIRVTVTNFSQQQRCGQTHVLVVYNMVSPGLAGTIWLQMFT